MRAVRVGAAGLALILASSCSSSGSSEPRAASAVSRSSASSPTADIQRASDSHAPWARLARRPLRIPRVRPGAPCPVTRRWTSGARLDVPAGFSRRPKLGSGPAYPGIYAPLRLWHSRTVAKLPSVAHPDFALPGGWLIGKVLWMMSRHYRHPVLVRGRQVDGDHRMRFFQGDSPPSQVRLLRNTNGPSNIAVPVAGCYAWQIDGREVSKVLVFRVVRDRRY